MRYGPAHLRVSVGGRLVINMLRDVEMTEVYRLFNSKAWNTEHLEDVGKIAG